MVFLLVCMCPLCLRGVIFKIGQEGGFRELSHTRVFCNTVHIEDVHTRSFESYFTNLNRVGATCASGIRDGDTCDGCSATSGCTTTDVVVAVDIANLRRIATWAILRNWGSTTARCGSNLYSRTWAGDGDTGNGFARRAIETCGDRDGVQVSGRNRHSRQTLGFAIHVLNQDHTHHVGEDFVRFVFLAGGVDGFGDSVFVLRVRKFSYRSAAAFSLNCEALY